MRTMVNTHCFNMLQSKVGMDLLPSFSTKVFKKSPYICLLPMISRRLTKCMWFKPETGLGARSLSWLPQGCFHLLFWPTILSACGHSNIHVPSNHTHHQVLYTPPKDPFDPTHPLHSAHLSFVQTWSPHCEHSKKGRPMNNIIIRCWGFSSTISPSKKSFSTSSS